MWEVTLLFHELSTTHQGYVYVLYDGDIDVWLCR